MTTPSPTRQSIGAPRWWRNPTRVLVITALAITAAWLAVALLWRDAPFAMTFDDSFYYFGIARNIAHGHGSTFDGVNSTNGYHPLWMLIAVAVFACGLDGTSAVRVMLSVQVLMLGAALVTLALTTGRAISNWPRIYSADGDGSAITTITIRAMGWCTAIVAVAFALAAGNPFIVKVFANGLESGVLVALDAVLLALAVRRGTSWLSTDRSTNRWGIGLLLALIVLARTDSIVLVAALGLWTMGEARTLGRRSIRPLLEIFGLPIVATGLYLVSNQLLFGSWLQISGVVKRQPLSLARVGIMVGIVVVAGIIGRRGYRRVHTVGIRNPRFTRVSAFTAATSWYAGFCIVIVAYYQVLQAQQWLWYYCPLALYCLFVLLAAVADFVESAVVEAPTMQAPFRALAPIAIILLIPLVAAMAFETRTFTDPQLRSILLANRDAGEWIDHHLPDDFVLGSWDAGVVGYYANRTVINLDGVANSSDYFEAARHGTIGQFLTDRGINGLVNHGNLVDGEDPDIRAFIKSNFGAAVEQQSTVIEKIPFRFSGNLTGGSGATSGTRPMAVFIYRLPT
ncbi:MAG: hypothetical protein WCK41_03775 [Actinomycetes bacterium]